MPYSKPFQVECFYSCDKQMAFDVLCGRKELKPFDTIRSSFSKEEEAYSGSNFTTRQHIQICVQNKDMIKGYFLPRPLKEYNSNL